MNYVEESNKLLAIIIINGFPHVKVQSNFISAQTTE